MHEAPQSAELVLNLHVSLDKATELERPEVNIPDSVVDFLDAHALAHADDGDIEPAAFPASAAVGADVAHFESIGVLKGRQFARGNSGGIGNIGNGNRITPGNGNREWE